MTMPRLPASCLSPWPGLAARLAALLVLAALCGCAAAPAPEIAWLRLPAQAAEPPARGAPTGDTWQLLAPLRLPGYLDRDALMLPSAGDSRGAVLRAADGLRWAEPLRDALPRLLGIDLGLALAAPVWQAPLPPGVVPTRQLRIELLAFDLQPGHRSVALQARFSLADADGRRVPRTGEATVTVPVETPGTEGLALAHRQALAVLAGRIAGFARASR
jgi:uncharacterized lipoprotein YmbA